MIEAPYFRQEQEDTCGPATARMALALHGVHFQRESAIAEEMGVCSVCGTTRRSMQRALSILPSHEIPSASFAELRECLDAGHVVVVDAPHPYDGIGHYYLVLGANGSLVCHDSWDGPYMSFQEHDFRRRWEGYHHNASYRGWMVAVKRPQDDLSSHMIVSSSAGQTKFHVDASTGLALPHEKIF